MSGRGTTRRRVAYLLLIAVVNSVLPFVSPVPVAEAAIYNPIPLNFNLEPTDEFVDDDALFVYVTSDIKGGTVYIVPASIESPDEASPSDMDWGGSNFIVGIGSMFSLIAGPPLKPGIWKLLTVNTEGTPTGLSAPFTVTACDTCTRYAAEAVVWQWKAAAAQNQIGAATYCAYQDGKSDYKSSKKRAERKQSWSYQESGVPLVSVTVTGGSPFTAGGVQAASIPALVIGPLSIAIPHPLEVAQQKAKAILKDLTCAVSQMYQDIVDDPPDPGYATVDDPFLGELGDLDTPEETALAYALREQRALAEASLVAFERYLGAVDDGNVAGIVRQANAAASYTSDLVRSLSDTAEALEDYADVADTDPELNGPVFASQAEIDELAAAYLDLRTTGFSSDDVQGLQGLGMTLDEIEGLLSQFDIDFAGAQPGTSLSDVARDLADTMRSTADDFDLFGREMAVIGARNALDLAVTADAGQDQTVVGPQAVYLDCGGSSSAAGTIETCEWDLGDGSPVQTGSVIGHDYVAPGQYTVTLTVTDSLGSTGTDTVLVTVENAPPTIAAPPFTPAFLRVSPGVQRTYSFTVTDWPAGGTVDVSVDLGDGSPAVTSSGSQPLLVDVPHAYAESGTFMLTVIATDSDGDSTQQFHWIDVRGLVADAGDDHIITEGSRVMIGGNVTTGVDEQTEVTVDPGDGSPGYTTGGPHEHLYRDDGVFTVTVTVTDDGPTVAVDQALVTVSNVAPEASVVHGGRHDAGLPTSLRAFVRDPGLDDVHTVTWALGDGTVKQGMEITHIFTPGIYEVTATVDDGDGGVVTASETVSIPVRPRPAANQAAGREFWIAFPRNSDGGGLQLTLFVASEHGTSGSVDVPGIGVSVPFSVGAGEVAAVEVPVEAESRGSLEVAPLGIRVKADDVVTVVGLSRIQFTTDAFLALPVDSLGTDHVVVSFEDAVQASYGAVVATENGTTVHFEPPPETRYNDLPRTIELDVGDTYLFDLTQGDDSTGTRITSDQPIAVFGGATCANVPVGYAWCDHLIEQLPPITGWGREFLTVPLAGRSGDTVRVVGGSSGTEVRVDGVLVATLGSGEHHDQILDALARIVTSKPALVAQYSNGTTFDEAVGDPFMMLVPPVEQYLPTYTVTAPAEGFSDNYLNVVVPTTSAGSVQVDAVPVAALSFEAIGTTGFSGAQVPVGPGTHRVTAAAPIGVWVYGFDDYDSYGYPGGFGQASLAVNPTPPAAPPRLDLYPSSGQMRVAWVPPTDNGGAPITGYEAISVPGAKTCSTTGATTCVITGLTDGQPYQFRVRAKNLAGWGPWATLTGFTDVELGQWFIAPAYWALRNDITTGFGGPDIYFPTGPVTRGQMATFLWRLMGSPAVATPHEFADVPSGQFYEPALRWAKATGVTTGWGGGNEYRPNQGVTRGQMAAFLWRLAGQLPISDAHEFDDVRDSDFYDRAVRWLRAMNVTSGWAGNPKIFNPDAVVDRAQMATFLQRLGMSKSPWASTVTYPSFLVP